MQEKEKAPLTEAIRSVFNSEVKWVIAILGFGFGIVTPFFKMTQDIALLRADVDNINSNHEVHIQDLTQSIKDLTTQSSTEQQEIIQLQKQIIVITGHLD